jgi:hypothetical protein
MIHLLDKYQTDLAPLGDGSDQDIVHIYNMLCRMRQFIPDDMMRAERWLGFIQGALWQKGIYSIEDMMYHNGDDPKEEPPQIYSGQVDSSLHGLDQLGLPSH